MSIKKLYLKLLLLVGVCFYFTNSHARQIEGAIKSIDNESLPELIISISGAKKVTVKNGRFTAHVKPQDLYSLRIEAEGYYPSYQTFSAYELKELSMDNRQESFVIPDITLIKKKQGRVMFAFAGDAMMGRRYQKPKFGEAVLIRDKYQEQDTKKILQYVKPYLQLADYSALNLESQISDKQPQERAPKSVTFYSPPQTLDALKWAGIDYVTLGNNHIYDYLDEGLQSTIKYLKGSGIDYSGAGLNQQEALKPHYQQLNGHNYAMLGYVGWQGGFTPNQVAEANKGGSAFGTMENIVKGVSQLSEKKYPTIVQYHGSLEYTDEPSGQTESRLKTAIDHGADLVIAHHPHVTQGFEVYKNKLIAYSMGNFIFDQYFHATPHSFILYVWMDGQSFYRAELVPVYIKGYAPTPATGIQRNTITKRTEYLSQKRGVDWQRSGGHLVLSPELKKNEIIKLKNVGFSEQEKIQPLYQLKVPSRISAVKSADSSLAYRLGENKVNGGDFESYLTHDSHERGWALSNGYVSDEFSKSGNYSAVLTLNGSQVADIGMKTFRRVFKAANPMSYKAKILNKKHPITAKLFLQVRKRRDSLAKAFDNKKQLIKEIEVSASDDWQDIEIDFNTPRVGYRSYRVFLELSNIDPDPTGQTITVFLDDIALVEWQAHYNKVNTDISSQPLATLATHIGIRNRDRNQQPLTLYYKQ